MLQKYSLADQSCRLCLNRPMEEETSQMSHLGLTNMTWTSLNLNLSLVRGQEEEVNLKVEEEVEGNSTSLNRLDTGLVYEAVVQV